MELTIQESPEQGVLFNQVQMAGISPVFIAHEEEEKQEEDEDYGADSFDRTPDTSQDHSNARKEFNTKNKLLSNASSSYSKSWYPFNSYFTSNLVS